LRGTSEVVIKRSDSGAEGRGFESRRASGGNSGPADCSGTFDFHVTNAWVVAHGWSAGTQLFAQSWSRDPGHPDGSGVSLSNALRFTVQP
jgi:hypothetical protein